ALPVGTLASPPGLPTRSRRGGRFPGLLARRPGDQSQELVDALVDRVWSREAKRRGWIVVSPAAPPSGLLFEPGPSALLPPFIARIAAAYPPAGGRVHLAGASNGGPSPFPAPVAPPP